MDNKVYYGEYTLKHWIDLILKNNIILPDYQRYFVWNENKIHTLIKTFKEKQFVPPVTIGAFKEGDKVQNLILDGQQRLTSILLAYFSLFPDKAKYKKTIEQYVDDNDDIDEEENQIMLDNVLEWTFKELTKKGKNRDDIQAEIREGNYKDVNYDIDEKFLNTTFLGFSYLVPDITTGEVEKIQQKYYSSVFRNINIQGEPLSPQESRASLYFLDKDLVPFFNPQFSKEVNVNILNTITKIDFVRYLSLLSQYHKDPRPNMVNKVARGYSSKMETYYEEYIYSIVGENNSQIFRDFETIFPNREYSAFLETLENTISLLDIPKEFRSIIDVDMYFLGLTYEILFNKKEVDDAKKNELKQELEDTINGFKQDYSHTRSPSAFKHLRNRIITSIGIYQKYTK